MSENDEQEEQQFPFDFDLFGMDLEEEFDRTVTPRLTFATLLKFIGGFEKYDSLPDDIKRHMLSFMDYKTRVKLSRCSKDNNRIEKETPIPVYEMSIKDTENQQYYLSDVPLTNYEIEVNFVKDWNAGNRFKVVFAKNEDSCDLMFNKYRKNQRPSIEKIPIGGDYHDQGVKFFEQWMKKCLYGVKGLTVEMKNYPMDTTNIKQLKQCKSLRIKNDNQNVLKSWLSKVSDLDSLELLPDESEELLSHEILAMDVVQNAKRIYFWYKAAFTPELFFGLKAKKFNIDTNTIQAAELNTFYKRWASGKGVEDFIECTIWHSDDKTYDKNVVLNGLTARPWDDDFENESGGFTGDFRRVCGSGDLYQIYSRFNSRISATLLFCSGRVSFQVTGRPFEYNGNIYDNLSIPL